MEFALIKNGSNSFYATPIFARINPYTKEDFYYSNSRYMVLDLETKKFKWVCRVSNELLMDQNGFFYNPNTHLVRDNYVADEFPWIVSEDIAHGVHYNGVLGDIFANISINDDADYEKLLALIETIPNGIIEKCAAICKDNPFPEYHMIKNSEDAWNLFFPTRNLSSSNFTDVDITDNKITIKLSSLEWDYNVEILFEDTPKVSKSVLKNPMAKWLKLWFVFDNETVYLLNNENADTVDDIKPSTKYFCGNKVSYKITPYAPK